MFPILETIRLQKQRDGRKNEVDVTSYCRNMINKCIGLSKNLTPAPKKLGAWNDANLWGGVSLMTWEWDQVCNMWKDDCDEDDCDDNDGISFFSMMMNNHLHNDFKMEKNVSNTVEANN